MRPAGGAPCAPTFDSDSGSGVLAEDVNGAFSITKTFQFSTAGSHVLCLWLASSSSHPNPVSGPQPETFNVAAPPTLIDTSATLRRHRARYSGKIVTQAGCRLGRDVTLRKVGNSQSFGRAVSRADGGFTIRRSRRVGGHVFVSVAARTKGQIVCRAGSSGRIRG